MSAVKKFFSITIFENKVYIYSLWFLVGMVAVVKTAFISGNYNNFLIFKYTFYSLLDQRNFFLPQPENFQHYNLYGPIFSVLIAPFAVLPNWLGVSLWVIFNCYVLLYAIRKLPIPNWASLTILLICAHENLTSIMNVQFNPSMTALVVLTFSLIHNKKNFWAALMIVIGTFIKLYGIVGLAFFFFSGNKKKLILGLAFWSVIAFILPMFFSSPSFIIQSYHDWYLAVTEKNVMNSTLQTDQDICLMGMVRRISGDHTISNLPFLLSGVVIFALPYLRFSQFKEIVFRLMILASTLVFTVIFSTSSESPTYIIAFVGVAIWFVCQERPYKPWILALFVFAMLLTSFSPSDIFPRNIRMSYIKPYALKALPCVLIWIVIIYQLLTVDFAKLKVFKDE